MSAEERGPIRQCVACRECASREDLIRLALSPNHTLVVDLRARLPGRGAWVHPDRECLARVEQRPGMLSRSLKAQPDTAGLCDRVKQAVLRALEDGLSLAAAGGGLVGGHDALVAALRAGEVAVVLTASDAAERTLGSIRAEAGDEVPLVPLPFDRDSLGARIGAAPRAVLGVRPDPASTHLRRQLRRLERLG